MTNIIVYILNGETKDELDTVPFYGELYHVRNLDEII